MCISSKWCIHIHIICTVSAYEGQCGWTFSFNNQSIFQHPLIGIQFWGRGSQSICLFRLGWQSRCLCHLDSQTKNSVDMWTIKGSRGVIFTCHMVILSLTTHKQTRLLAVMWLPSQSLAFSKLLKDTSCFVSLKTLRKRTRNKKLCANRGGDVS